MLHVVFDLATADDILEGTALYFLNFIDSPTACIGSASKGLLETIEGSHLIIPQSKPLIGVLVLGFKELFQLFNSHVFVVQLVYICLTEIYQICG